ncbi:MAG: alpha/beta hydrolase, partial [Coleofasciculaceae cyanobacterium SM2_3_26]|nr:alpha/beta hydrolase [Coleofasciculaceae cyanobacterium SM2_3_26]
ALQAHSMGASIATLFLNRYPERVERAILTCSGIFEYDERSFTTFHQVASWVVKFRPRWLPYVPWSERFFMARFLHRTIPTAASRAFLEDYLMADSEATVQTIYTSVSKQAAEVMPGEFTRLQVPTLLISGEKDIIIPAEMGRRAAILNQSFIKYLVLPKTAHFPMLEDEPTYLLGVREFWA